MIPELPPALVAKVPRIWTIGHSDRPLATFVDLLHENKIKQLVDVRHFPGSRSFPWFSAMEGGKFPQEMTRAGIKYQWIEKLGGRRRLDPTKKLSAVWRNPSFGAYAEYMETPDFQQGMQQLLRMAAQAPTAFMCSEAVWWRCHRSMIADALEAAGVHVMHILSKTKVEEHPMTSAAVVTNGRLSYEGQE